MICVCIYICLEKPDMVFKNQDFQMVKESSDKKFKEHKWNPPKYWTIHQENVHVGEYTPLNTSGAQILNQIRKEGFLSRPPLLNKTPIDKSVTLDNFVKRTEMSGIVLKTTIS